jgi:Iap family predicted aminopeptidase
LIRADIAELASDEMNGRHWRSEDGWRAARWVAARFAGAGLEPLPGRTDMFVAVTDDVSASPNVVAWIPPAATGARRMPLDGTSQSTGPVVAISAHFDHLRPARRGEDRIFNGADDNASGVCAMIAAARALHEARVRGSAPGVGIICIAFTGEEAGLIGSRAFVRDGTVPTDLMVALVNMDMVSRSDDGAIRVDGGDVGAPVTAALVKLAPQASLPLVVDTHPEWLPRSDQGPFLGKGVPSVLLSVEDHADYHTVDDEVDRIDADLAARTARLVCRTIEQLAAPGAMPPR